MKKKLRVLIIGLITFVVAVLIGVKYILSSDLILVKFDIISVTNKNTEYHIKFDKVKAAKYYRVTILDSNNIKIFDSQFSTNDISITLSNLMYQEQYSLMVYAYDKYGDYRPANQEYLFTWNEPVIKNEELMLNDNDYELIIDGDLSQNNYSLEITKNNKKIVEKKLTENSFMISKEYYENEKTSLNVKILNEKVLISEITLYNNLNPIHDLKILAPKKNETLSHGDITLSYSGGENALNYMLNIKKNNKIVASAKVSKKNIILSKDLFDYGSTYSLELVGSYNDFQKIAETEINISEKSLLNPVYISNNWKYVKKGTKIELKNVNPDAKIYYTLNGDNPESMGMPYNEPIEIKDDLELKTVAVLDGYDNSPISTYNIHVGEKEKLTVYLSPSNQHANIGVESTGYTNERDEMNDLTNYIEERLKEYGVRVVRNQSSGNINLWIKESTYAGADVHLAVHSNASVNHDKYGIETWVHANTSLTYSLANKIQNNLMSIYPDKEKEGANRGVKFANGALGEVNDNYLPFGILVEIAHHDYESDALWIMQNKKLIAYNIADSILKYYQIID